MKIVNIGLVAHVDAGKTTLTEQLLLHAGALRTAGAVDSGTTRTDTLSVERERGISVKAASVSLVHEGVRLNVIDTPGHVDFAAEVERALSVLDTAVLVISAVEGVQAQTELLYEALRATGTNVVFFVNKIDRTGSDTAAVVQQIRDKFGAALLPFNRVTHEGDRDAAVSAVSFADDAMQEAAAESDDALLTRYLSGEALSDEEVAAALGALIAAGEVSPLLFGSSLYGLGVSDLLSLLTRFGQPIKNNRENPDALSGVVYRITHDKTMGRVAHVRLFGGELHTRDRIRLQTPGVVIDEDDPPEEQKITQIRRYDGERYTDTGEASRGDVVALCGLSNARVSDILGEAAELLHYPLSVPLLQVRVLPPSPEVLAAFNELSAEDPHLNVEYNQDEKELTICITGMVQVEILRAVVRERYGLDVTFSAPSVIYKETPLKTGIGREAYTMPKPCWAVIDLKIEPLPRGAGYRFESVVQPRQIHYKYQTHIATELPRALKQGIYNWEVTDLKITLVGGGHHVQHTHPLDFFLATPLALIHGLQETGTTLLEPMQHWRISADEALVGRVIGDIIAMRGTYDSPMIEKGQFTMEARVPVATSMDYAVRLASLTSGRGMLSVRFDGYEPCPLELGAVAKRRGCDPRDRAKWILTHRGAMQESFR